MYIKDYGRCIVLKGKVFHSFEDFLLALLDLPRKGSKPFQCYCLHNGVSTYAPGIRIRKSHLNTNILILGFNINISGEIRPRKIKRKMIEFYKKSPATNYMADFLEKMD